MTSLEFVFLTLMFGVITPSPTHGKIKLTLHEAFSNSSSGFEKRLSGNPDTSESDALFSFKRCLEEARLGIGESCHDNFADKREAEMKKKYEFEEDIPFDAWIRYARLRFGRGVECGHDPNTCRCRPELTAERCKQIAQLEKFTCEKEYLIYYKFLHPVDNPTIQPQNSRSHGFRVSIAGWCITVMVAFAISRRRHSSP